jgi:DNA-binding beta-propeller fold protein YncE
VIGQGEEGHTGGSGNGELAGPSGVAINETTGDVYVVDPGNSRVEVFEASGAYVSQFGGGETPAGSFSAPTAVAVDQRTGDIYVADTGHDVVDKFTSTGTYSCELSGVGRGCRATPTESPTFLTPDGVAVDPTTGKPTSGDVYVSDRENKVVDVFTELGGDVAQFSPEGKRPWSLAVDASGNVFVAMVGEERVKEYTAAGAEFIGQITGGVRTVGVDLQDGDIFVGAELGGVYELREFDPFGNELGNFGASLMSAPGTASPGIAVNSTTNVVYAADTGNNLVDMFGLVTIPDTLTDAATGIGSTDATLHGEANPDETKGASYYFEYGESKLYGLTSPAPPGTSLGEGGAFVPASTELGGLTPGTRYHYRLDATNSTGLVDMGKDETFETLPLAPIVNELSPTVSEVSTEGVFFHGVVNPNHGSTTYHFAYGPKAHDYTQSLPGVGIGCGGEGSAEGCGTTPVAVEQASPPGGLSPDTVYHFALIATNAGGTTEGEDETFRTPPAGAPPAEPPVVSTGPAVAVGANGATLEGLVYAEGLATTYEFEVGFEAGGTVVYSTALFGHLGPESTDPHVSQEVGGLQPGRVYHYRLLAFNSADAIGVVSAGTDRTFTTATVPTGIVQPITPGLIPTPVFPPVKYPKPPPKKHHKVKKHGKPRPKHAKGRATAKSRTHR